METTLPSSATNSSSCSRSSGGMWDLTCAVRFARIGGRRFMVRNKNSRPSHKPGGKARTAKPRRRRDGGKRPCGLGRSCGLSQRGLKLSEATNAGVWNAVIRELRKPGIGHAGFSGDLLPLALSLDQSGLERVGVYVLHCRLIAKFCCPYKQFFEDCYGYSV